LCLMVILAIWPVFWQDRYFGLLVAALVITLTGIVDDIYGMKASAKLVCQLGAGAVLYGWGYRLERISVPLTNAVVDLGGFDFVLTVLGVAAIINAINMLDGLDGLAAGSVFIMSSFLLFHKVTQGATFDVGILVAVMGMALAFLRYNSYPAKVFMGDTGAMFLGLIMAAEVLDSASQGTAVATLLLPVAILGIPVFDMFRLMATRVRESRAVFSADKNHVHHSLLALGLSHRKVVWFIYAMNVQIGIMATIYKHVTPSYRGLYLVSIGLFLFIAFYLINSGNGAARETGDSRSESNGSS
jgi:UDP-GlcNAc:undecaprenyl-phosphate/decaprenyl-phosphate GlcNAc-1-phosphate transferase